jgi:ureidoglycolate dehydrogenase (NAD+)
MGEVLIEKDKIRELVVRKLIKGGLNDGEANIVADVLIHADLRGVSSHGVLRTKHYVKRLTEGGLNPSPNYTIKQTGPVTAIFDGDNGMGHVIAKKAMEYAIKTAKENGVGMVAVINSSHCGALSYFVQVAARENLIGIALTHTDKSVVPFGSVKPFFGTNPLAFAFPAKRNEPIILDMATSNVALGKILHARELGNKVPMDWGVDEKGNPSTNPHQIVHLLPMGGAKGYGLAMVVDILSGILTGSAFGPHISMMYGDYDKYRGLGHFLCVIDPGVFTNTDLFLEQIDQMIDEIHELPPAPGFDKVMVPGEPEQLQEKRRNENGIPLPESVYEFLRTV